MNIIKSVLAGAALVASFSAVAGRSDQSFGVRLVVEDACRVGPARFAQGPQEARKGAPVASAGIDVTCAGASPYRVDVAVGAVPMPSVEPAADDATTLVISY